MKRSGFTMIELVFVIVILGILASVAIPKLAATRDDAKIASKASEIQAAISEIPAYVTAQGKVLKPAAMSQVLAQLVKQGDKKAKEVAGSITGTKGAVELYVQNGSSTDKVFTLDVNDTTMVFKKATLTATAGTIAKQLQKRIEDANYTIGGTSIEF
jgi:general secretion pathway protein G